MNVWPRRLLLSCALGLLAAAEGPLNLYGWPVHVAPAPLEGSPAKVPAFRPGDSARRLPDGLLLGREGPPDGDLLLSGDMELALVSSWEQLRAIDLDDGRERWSWGSESSHAATFSPDGELAVLSSDSEVRVVDLDSGRRGAPWDLEDEDGWLNLGALAISPDGERAALYRNDTTRIELRELPDGELIRAFPAADAADTLRFSPDGERLFGFGPDGLRLWELDTGRVRYVEDDPRWRGGAVNRDLSVAYMVGDEGLLERIELKAGGRRQAWRLPGAPELYRVLSLDDGRVVVGGEASALYVVDARTGRLTHALEGDGQLSLSADGQWLRAVERGSWAAWRVKDLEPRRVGAGHLASVQALALGGGLVASGDERGSVLVRRVKDGATVAHLFGDTGPVTGLALPPEGSPAQGQVFVGDAWGQIWSFDLKTGEQKIRLDFGKVGWEAGEVTALAFSEDGRVLAASRRGDDCGSCGEVRFFDAETFALLGTIKGEGYDRLIPWRALFVASGYESEVRVLSTLGPAALRGEPDHYEAEVWAVARDDGALVLAREGRDADLLYTLGQAEPMELETCGPIALSADGRRLVAEDCDGGFAVLDTATGQAFAHVPWPVDEDEDWIYAAVADASTLALGWGSGRVSLHALPAAPLGGGRVALEAMGPLGTLSGQEGWVAPSRALPEPRTPETLPPDFERVYRRGDCDTPIELGEGLSLCADGRVTLSRHGEEIARSDYLGYGQLVARGGDAWHAADGKLSRLSLGADSLRVTWTAPLPVAQIQDLALGGQRLLVVSGFASALVDAETGAVLRYLEGHPGGAELGALSPDGSLAATGSREGAVVWKDGAPWMFIPEDASGGLGFSADGRALVLRGRSGAPSSWALGR
ncbi:MAG: PQQ-binding-like beta-propeller repeat protein [Alphaproteobacteria bacterium]|nr:PQQ-binding-like beta-propeller repeat protein [Alphaproteobacteria bacterium]